MGDIELLPVALDGVSKLLWLVASSGRLQAGVLVIHGTPLRGVVSKLVMAAPVAAGEAEEDAAEAVLTGQTTSLPDCRSRSCGTAGSGRSGTGNGCGSGGEVRLSSEDEPDEVGHRLGDEQLEFWDKVFWVRTARGVRLALADRRTRNVDSPLELLFSKAFFSGGIVADPDPAMELDDSSDALPSFGFVEGDPPGL